MSNENMHIVCVSNNLETFESVINSNPNMNKYKITNIDNSIENIGISKCYNSFIDKKIDENSDFWVVFCHQDFGFNEDPMDKLSSLDKNNIYGPIGIRNKFNLYKGLKGILAQVIGVYPVFRFLRKDKNGNFKLVYIEKEKIKKGFFRGKMYGQILQGTECSTFRKIGKRIKDTIPAVVLDCCCIMVHSSLIFQNGLRFDEKLNWHMYVEDFCLDAKINHNIQTKIVQLDCYHLGIGTLNDDFYKCFDYVKNKYSLKYIKTTCYES